MDTQKFICEAFGYKEILPIDLTAKYVFREGQKWSKKYEKDVEVFGISKKDKPFIKIVKDNTDKRCIMCGQVHPIGYTSDKGVAHLMDSMVSATYNWVYKFNSTDNFICEYCGYASVAYNSDSKMPLGKKMVNVLIQENKVTYKNFNSNSENELYNILAHPPEPPFVILANPPGTVLYNMVFVSEPTLSKNLIVVNYGMDNLRVKPDEVFRSIEDAAIIADEFKLDQSSDHIWNRTNSVSISTPLVFEPDFVQKIGKFISQYSRDTRIVAKMVMLAYLKKNKIKKPLKLKTIKVKKQANLFNNLY